MDLTVAQFNTFHHLNIYQFELKFFKILQIHRPGVYMCVRER